MAQSNEPPVIKPASAKKQNLRQQQVQRLQTKRKHSSDNVPIPVMAPIDDKYIFGLSPSQQNLQKSNPDANTLDANAVDADTESTDSVEHEDESENRYKARDYSEVWESKEFIDTPSGGTFCCYSAGLAHSDLVFVCLHGCGHSALSYSLMAKVVAAKHQIFSFDYRGHGYSTMNPQKDANPAHEQKEACLL